ncbi:hypothetical protein AKJ40_03565 [candidate division MSBL1 archaeon SCGC-AAA259M10]|uniref:ABC transporter domain-containing protein n=1 Tax=candidate division MSBL1 archaeon SCGC-AAA259M10 TaxID=1698270 RepID=A0A133UYG8_9EURY|nr:hypothetical protein AKJ40_03565 [candidate division MSBL1 archaeon SCGC-AAA259M10]
MIDVNKLNAFYGDIQVLWNLSLKVEENDFVTVVGPNGAGKSALLKAISGLLEKYTGRIEVFSNDISELNPYEVVELGCVLVPEGKNLFTDMTVMENLEMGAYTERAREKKDETLEEVFDLFPILSERRYQLANNMSGGEQRMLAIGRGLMTRPKILALDEPSSGLAPQLTQKMFEKVEEISKEITILLVEQHVRKALALADKSYLLGRGRIVAEGEGEDLLSSGKLEEVYGSSEIL